MPKQMMAVMLDVKMIVMKTIINIITSNDSTFVILNFLPESIVAVAGALVMYSAGGGCAAYGVTIFCNFLSVSIGDLGGLANP